MVSFVSPRFWSIYVYLKCEAKHWELINLQSDTLCAINPTSQGLHSFICISMWTVFYVPSTLPISGLPWLMVKQISSHVNSIPALMKPCVNIAHSEIGNLEGDLRNSISVVQKPDVQFFFFPKKNIATDKTARWVGNCHHTAFLVINIKLTTWSLRQLSDIMSTNITLALCARTAPLLLS